MSDDSAVERKALADELRAEAIPLLSGEATSFCLDAAFVGSSDRTLSIGQVADEIEQGTTLGLELFEAYKGLREESEKPV